MSRLKPQPTDVAFYEGLCFKTASMYVGVLEDEFDDIRQVLRVKVWRALQSYDPGRSSLPIQRYVFSCVRNQVKDLVKRKRRNELYMEDFPEAVQSRHLATTHDEVYGSVEDPVPVMPNTLGDRERDVLSLLCSDFSQREAAAFMGLSRGEMERAVRGIRTKLADWKPSPGLPAPAVEPELLPLAA